MGGKHFGVIVRGALRTLLLKEVEIRCMMRCQAYRVGPVLLSCENLNRESDSLNPRRMDFSPRHMHYRRRDTKACARDAGLVKQLRH